MFSNQELVFAQEFPFSPTAKRVLKKYSFELEKTPEEVIKRAVLMISSAAKNKPYLQEHLSNSPELLVQEIQAFPIAKILVSYLDRFDLFDRFAGLVSESTFSYLTNAKNRRELLLDLAHDLEVSFELDEKGFFFCRIPLLSFLQANFKESFMKLVNQPVESGMVFLPENDFCRFLSEVAREKTRDSLPVQLKNVPKSLLHVGSQLKEQLVFKQKKAFFTATSGNVTESAFPPCMAQLYSDLLEGKNVGHAARFNIATFLVAIGMPPSSIVDLFRKTPNFNEKVTVYQVERIAGKGNAKYSPSSCAKMRSYNLCVAHCPVSHPLQFYENALKGKTKKDSATVSKK